VRRTQPIAFAVVLPILFAAHGCLEKWDAVDPRSQAKTADDPCGPLWGVCLDMQGKDNGSCCPDGETCGGGKYSVGCPAGQCCYVGEGARLHGDGGASWVVAEPQRRLVQ
jgi:hypothetical protein